MSFESPSTPESPGARRAGRVRVRLGDLMVWVLGAGLIAAVCRGTSPTSWLVPVVDGPRILGLVAAVLTTLVWTVLLHEVVTRLRRAREEAGGAWAAAVGWRLAALVLLGGSLVAEAQALRTRAEDDSLADPQSVRVRILPLAMTFALAGILAALAPRDRPEQEPVGRIWPSALLAALAGLAMAASQAILPYLVLLAMDAVRNAMTGPAAIHPLRPMLPARLVRAGAETAPVVACCVALGVLLLRDLRRPTCRATGGEQRTPWGLAAATFLSAAGAAWLVAVTIPELEPWLSTGLRDVVDPVNASIILLGFAGLAVGPAASATAAQGMADPAGAGTPRWAPWVRGLGNLALGLFLIDVIAARVCDLVIIRRVAYEGSSVPGWAGWIGWVDAGFEWIRSVLPFPSVTIWHLYEAPGWVALALFESWVAWRLVGLLVRTAAAGPAPIDPALGDRRAAARFLLRWTAMTVLMTAALPAFLLAGLVLIHLLIRTHA